MSGEGEADLERTFGPALDAALAPWRTTPGPLVVLFSGGVDSGVLAWMLRDRGDLALLTVGRPGAADLSAAKEAASALDLPWRGAVVDDAALESGLRSAGSELSQLPRARQAIFLALATAVQHAPEGTILCGQGADELFLGYRHFQGLTADAAAERSRRDLEQLQHDDWPRTERIAAAMGRRVVAPYLDPAVVGAATSLPIAARYSPGEPKAEFRRWAVRRGVPDVVAHRPKRAMQYGTGIDRWLRDRTAGPA